MEIKTNFIHTPKFLSFLLYSVTKLIQLHMHQQVHFQEDKILLFPKKMSLVVTSKEAFQIIGQLLLTTVQREQNESRAN